MRKLILIDFQANGNKSLLTPKEEEDKLLKEHEEKEYTQLIKMLIALRQNLEKVRNKLLLL